MTDDWLTALDIDPARDREVADVLSRFGSLAEYWSIGASPGEDDSPAAAWVVARLAAGERGLARLIGLLWREIEGVRARVDEHLDVTGRQHLVEATQQARRVDQSFSSGRPELARHAAASVAALAQALRSTCGQNERLNFGAVLRCCFRLVEDRNGPSLLPEPIASAEHLQRERAALLEAIQRYEPHRAHRSLRAAWSDSGDPRSLVLAAAGELEDFAVRRSILAVCQKCIRELVAEDPVLGGTLPGEGLVELATLLDAARLAACEAAARGARALASLGRAMEAVRTPAQLPAQVRAIVLAHYALHAAEALSHGLARVRAIGGDEVAVAQRWAGQVRSSLKAPYSTSLAD